MDKYKEESRIVIQVYSNNESKVKELLSDFKSSSSFNVVRETKDSIAFDNNILIRVSGVNSGARGIRWNFAIIDLESLDSLGEEMKEEVFNCVIMPSGCVYSMFYKEKPDGISYKDHIYYF